mmetsp:Transcript_11713/g.18450  ORF Transcript_11713/g.18450 Transcript_11713/m.18450 type:complete len:184 (-) Transcript_11713:114-665(-)|eukprot:CAMPEP_0117030408 /NCGR_PEP_ID=MMETSP0472-20121206/21953_1 /TAXON_ID=693140 ORGANISM="Tiarina fusus, Strain LIS" /NCGR_SAMPLE_ID=MMETSP0472 /ASSEMBLY_ACC=CAM_ASM_000603 /LENGTH=183 /DNA_ID=CAMNT_0004738477 /DNA_START=112 /DNA_END=663 /DNA_ORIENTATION=-
MVSTRRRVQRDKGLKYAVGDKVEVVRVGGIDVGILLAKADEDKKKGAAAVHWLVSVEGGENDEELISEKSLGRVLEAHDSDDSIKSATVTAKGAKKVAKKTSKSKQKSTKSQGSRRISTRAATKKDGKGKSALIDGLDMDKKAPSPRPKKKQGDETVVEVKMLTGTLFIYRGEHRRVEFVRTS